MQMITGNDKNLYRSSTVLYLARSDFSGRAIVTGHPLNLFDVLFFDSIIVKLTQTDGSAHSQCPYCHEYTVRAV